MNGLRVNGDIIDSHHIILPYNYNSPKVIRGTRLEPTVVTHLPCQLLMVRYPGFKYSQDEGFVNVDNRSVVSSKFCIIYTPSILYEAICIICFGWEGYLLLLPFLSTEGWMVLLAPYLSSSWIERKYCTEIIPYHKVWKAYF